MLAFFQRLDRDSSTALMLQLRNYSLKNKRVGGWFSFLPSLYDLDLISVRLLVFGVMLLSGALVESFMQTPPS